MAKAKKEVAASPGRISIDDLRSRINKNSSFGPMAYDLDKEIDKFIVDEYISTGCTWLDYIISSGRKGGIPVKRITELSGISASGKSYLKAVVMANAQKMGFTCFDFDTEFSVDPKFYTDLGVDVSSIIYLQPACVEDVFETIEDVLGNLGQKRCFFAWDSLANTPVKSEIVEGSSSPIAERPRVISNHLRKIVNLIGNSGSVLLYLNQLKTNIGNIYEPFFTPGGQSLIYASSLRIWLTTPKSKDSYVTMNGFRIGSSVRAEIKKSRFGTEGRKCEFKILWNGPNLGIDDYDSIFNALKPIKDIGERTESFTRSGAWYNLFLKDGEKICFQESKWRELLDTNVDFKERVLELLKEVYIHNFARLEGNANVHFVIGDDVEENEEDVSSDIV